MSQSDALGGGNLNGDCLKEWQLSKTYCINYSDDEDDSVGCGRRTTKWMVETMEIESCGKHNIWPLGTAAVSPCIGWAVSLNAFPRKKLAYHSKGWSLTQSLDILEDAHDLLTAIVFWIHWNISDSRMKNN